MAGIADLNSDASGGARRHGATAGLVARRLAVGLATGLFVIAVPVALIVGSVRFAFSWQPVYTYAITAYHADEVTGVSTAELLRATHIIRNYFTNGQRDLDITVIDRAGQQEALFNAREIAHMRDVKALVDRFYTILTVAILYLAAFVVLTLLMRRHGLRRLAQALLAGALLTAGLLVAFGIAAFTSFDQLFIDFHELSFSNDFWELDPARDHLIQMFPAGFWSDVTLFVGLVAITAALLVALLSGTYLLVSRRRASS